MKLSVEASDLIDEVIARASLAGRQPHKGLVQRNLDAHVQKLRDYIAGLEAKNEKLLLDTAEVVN